jgi:hypothetical protein
MENGRNVRRRHANSNTRPDANTRAQADTNTRAHADTNTDPEPGHGMQRGSDLDCERDLYGRPAGEPERLHL